MKANKKTMFAAALAVAVIALAGVGYAATHTAVTVNQGNSASAAFATAEQETYTALFTGTIDFDTYTDANHTVTNQTAVYVLQTNTVEVTTNVHGALLGNAKTITLDDVGLTSPTYSLKVTSTGTTVNAGWDYYIAVTDNASTQYVKINDANASVDITPVSNNNTVTVQLVIAGADFETIDSLTYAAYADHGASKTYHGESSILASFNVEFVFTATTNA